jgi:hypothetical protein
VVERAYGRTGGGKVRRAEGLQVRKKESGREEEIGGEEKEEEEVEEEELVGWKAIKKGDLKRKRRMSAVERIEEARDKLLAEGVDALAPAEETVDYLKEGIAEGRFVWPPPPTAKFAEEMWREKGGVDAVSCDRCRMLKFDSCICDIKRGGDVSGLGMSERREMAKARERDEAMRTVAKKLGGHADSEDDEETDVADDSDDGARQPRDDGVKQAGALNYVYNEQEGRIELINPPITPEVAKRLNASGKKVPGPQKEDLNHLLKAPNTTKILQFHSTQDIESPWTLDHREVGMP